MKVRITVPMLVLEATIVLVFFKKEAKDYDKNKIRQRPD